VINTWNDTYSPSKPLLSPQKPKFLPTNDSADDSPTSSPKKRRPSKKPDPSIVAGRAARKAFEASKDALAHAFLTSLDTLTTSSCIAALTAPTGGTKIIWSKTLKTTAGRANWRRESFRTRTSDGIVETKYRNHASIELATKVIDNEDRLRNVIAHEFCHLATFMIDGQRGSPHGAEFKAWAQRVGRLFGDQGVEVTTKHSYVIEFKFVWECESCGCEFKRHSRSVDPMRHTCGKCRGRLVQTRPVPRGGGKGADREEGGAGGEYRVFVKENFGRVKKELEEKGAEAGMGKVMEVLGREYRERKAGDAAKSSDKTADENFRDVESAFEALTVAD
jgi:predicted SprT family Zn-dependent metalloprotease